MKCNVARIVLLLLAAARVDARTLQAGGERPVMKVVRLLQDMKAQLEKEKADDEAVFESLDCWCKTNEEEKTKALEAGQAKASWVSSQQRLKNCVKAWRPQKRSYARTRKRWT